jgi:hypothetical protein
MLLLPVGLGGIVVDDVWFVVLVRVEVMKQEGDHGLKANASCPDIRVTKVGLKCSMRYPAFTLVRESRRQVKVGRIVADQRGTRH